MLDILFWPMKFWNIILLVLLIADKIVTMTPMPWDDLIVTSIRKLTEKIKSIGNNIIAYVIVKPIKWMFFNKNEDEE